MVILRLEVRRMTITLDLAPDVKAGLEARARTEGKPLDEFLRDTLGGLAASLGSQNAATLDMLDAWDAEDATADPEEMNRREAEWQELQKNLNANRAATSERPLFS